MFPDDEEAIAIVPLTEDQESAMEAPHFQALLKRIGVKPPVDEQVSFHC